MNVPERPLGRQRLVHIDRAFLCGPSHGKFHDHDRKTQQDQAGNVDQHEDGTAVLTGDVGEFPDIADTDGAAGAEQDEAQTATQMFTIQKYHLLMENMRTL